MTPPVIAYTTDSMTIVASDAERKVMYSSMKMIKNTSGIRILKPAPAMGRRGFVPADGRLGDVLDVTNHQFVTRDGVAIDRDVREVALRHSLCVRASRAWNAFKCALDLSAQPLNFIQIGTENLDP